METACMALYELVKEALPSLLVVLSMVIGFQMGTLK